MTPTTAAKKDRRPLLDFLRALAIFSVLVCHSAQATWGVTSTSLTFGVLKLFGRLGVPIFLFLTGSLVLGKQFKTSDDFKRFYVHNFLPLLATVEIWTVIYNLYLLAVTGQFDFLLMLQQMVFFRQLPIAPWWYVPMIVGIYLVLPFVAVAIQSVPKKWLAAPMAIMVAYFFCYETYSSYASAIGIQPVAGPVLDMGFYGGMGGFYIILGYLLDKCRLLRKTPAVILLVAGIVSIAVLLYFEHLDMDLWYSNVFILILSASIFEIALRREPSMGRISDGPRSVLATISKASFGVYLCHFLFRDFAVVLTASIDWNFARFIVILAVLIVGSLVLVSVFWRSKRARLLLFDSK